MKNVACLLLALWFSGQVMAQQRDKSHPLNFKLRMTEIAHPDSLALEWVLLPLNPGQSFQSSLRTSFFPKSPGADGFYHLTISLPDSVMHKQFGYAYKVAGDTYDFERFFPLDSNKVTERVEFWGYLDEKSMVKPTRMLFIRPGSPEESTMFSKPYAGITTDGKVMKDLFPVRKTRYSMVPVKNAVLAFLSSLTAEQKALSVFPVESEEWRRWHNIENWKRAGVCLEDMNSHQKALVFAFLKESLSVKGLQKAKDIMSMEAYLATLVPGNKNLGGEKYWFTFYGEPSDTEPWGWQIEGHHLVINYFVLGDQVVMTPVFMGSEPTLVQTGQNKGLRTFEIEEKKGLDFFLSLSEEQKKVATLWHTKDYDFNRSEAFRDNEIVPTAGIPATKLSKQQQNALLDLVGEYVSNIRDSQAKVKMEEVRARLNETHFTWVQGEDINSPFYYRIHSPVVLIEFDHQVPVFLPDTAGSAYGPVKTHIHTVVRTPNGNDYGKNLLREHLEKHPHHGLIPGGDVEKKPFPAKGGKKKND